VPLTDLASYIGVRKETLSRIRQNIKSEKMNLNEYLNAYDFLSVEAKRAILNVFNKTIHLKKGDFLLKEGEFCNGLYFIQTGIIYSHLKGIKKQTVSWIRFEGDVFSSPYSLINRCASFESFIALEDSLILYSDHTDILKLYIEFPEVIKLSRVMHEAYYIQLEERTQSLQTKTAEERYKTMLKMNLI